MLPPGNRAKQQLLFSVFGLPTIFATKLNSQASEARLSGFKHSQTLCTSSMRCLVQPRCIRGSSIICDYSEGRHCPKPNTTFGFK